MQNIYLRKTDQAADCPVQDNSEIRARERLLLPFRQILAIFAFLLVITGNVFAQTAYVPVPAASNSTSGNPRGPSGAFAFQRVASIYSAAEMASLNPAFPLTSIGFNIASFPPPPAAAPTPSTGNIKIVGSSRVDLQACKLEYSIVSPK